MSVSLTAKAAKHIQKMLAETANGHGVRLALKPAGCSGFKYAVEVAKDILETDQVFESQGVKIIVDKKNVVFIDGTEIDYIQEGLNSKLTFSNPQVEDSCGCGESVTFKEKQE